MKFLAKVLKQNADIFSNNICNFFSFCVNEGKLPNISKNADISPAFKKVYRGYKGSYRSMSILLVIAKIFGKLLRKQENIFMDQFLSKYQCGFQKGYIAQQCLLVI